MNEARTYSKYYVKRKPGSKEPMLNEDGSPVLGDLVKDNIRITPSKADILNFGWDNKELYVTFYYVEQKSAKQEPKAEKSEARLAMEKEADKLGVKFRENIGDEKLQFKINEAKGE